MEIKSKLEIPDLMRDLELPMIAVECGTAEGRYSLDLLQRGIEKLYLIDVWERVPFIDGCASWPQEWHDNNYNDLLERIEPYKERVVLLKGFSYKMANEIPDESCGYVFIDADHTANGVKADIESFWPKLVKGGIMAFHDFGNLQYGVNQAVQQFTKNQGVHHLVEDGNYVNWGCYLIKGEYDYGI